MPLFQDSFETGLGGWNVFPTPATPLTLAHSPNPVHTGKNSAEVKTSLNRMYHGLKKSIIVPFRFTFWIYDPLGKTKQTRFFADIRGHHSGQFTPGGAHQVFAAGVNDVSFVGSPSPTGIFAGGTPDPKRYQGRVLLGVNSGWFNLKRKRTPGWHQFRILRQKDETVIKFFVDDMVHPDTIVTRVAPSNLDTLVMGSVGIGVGVKGQAFFDDFQVDI